MDAEKNRAKCRKFYYSRKERDPEGHKAKQNRNSKKWRKRNPDKVKNYSAKRRKQNPEYYSEARKRSRLKAKSDAISAYGICPCGVHDHRILTLDHIGGGGSNDRPNKSAGNMWFKVRKLNYPDSFRVLCFNCNFKDHIVRLSKSWSMTKRAISERKRKRTLKENALNNYGKKCKLCHVNDVDVLNIDHINESGGGRQRKRSGWRLYKHLKDLGYPTGYQTLCFNCNILKYLEQI